MRSLAIRVAVTLSAFTSGVLLQSVTYRYVAEQGLVNLFWGTLYGVGWHLVNEIGARDSFFLFIIGYYVWPAIVTAAVFMLAKRVGKIESKRGARWGLVAFLCSLMVIASAEAVTAPPLDVLPHFYRALAEDS